ISRRVCLRLPLYSASPKVSCIVVVRCVYAIVAGSRGVVQSFLSRSFVAVLQKSSFSRCFPISQLSAPPPRGAGQRYFGQDAIAALHRAGLTKSAQVQQLKVRANQVTGYKWHVRLTGTRLAET
ncbi:hypothetical protein, partial [Xanthomonas vasicola]